MAGGGPGRGAVAADQDVDLDLVGRFRRARGDPGCAVLEGLHALKHALRFGAALEMACSPDLDALQRLAGALAPDLVGMLPALVTEVPHALFVQLAPVPPDSGVLAVARRPATPADGGLAEPGNRPVVLLDDPTHTGNLGAAIRVAAAADAAGVVTIGRLDPWHPAALRASAGLHFALPVVRLAALPATDRPLVAIDPVGTALDAAPLPERPLLAFGSERRGLAPAILARAASRLAIPMTPGVSSLNLATAVAVVLYAWRLGLAPRAPG